MKSDFRWQVWLGFVASVLVFKDVGCLYIYSQFREVLDLFAE